MKKTLKYVIFFDLDASLRPTRYLVTYDFSSSRAKVNQFDSKKSTYVAGTKIVTVVGVASFFFRHLLQEKLWELLIVRNSVSNSTYLVGTENTHASDLVKIKIKKV